MGGRGSSSGMRSSGGGGSTAAGSSAMSAFGGQQGVSDATYNELSNQMGRQYRREYAEGIAQGGAEDVHFPDMVQYIARNSGVTLPSPENRPYRDVIREAFGATAFNTLVNGMQEGARRWLDENPRRRRR